MVMVRRRPFLHLAPSPDEPAVPGKAAVLAMVVLGICCAIALSLPGTISAAADASIDVSLCGQMSASPIYTMLLLGMGLRSLSVPPGAIPEIKKICRSVSIEKCREVAEVVAGMESSQFIDNYVREELKKIAPDLFV